MMQSTEDWNRCDVTDLLPPSRIGSIFIQRKMGPDFVVIRGVVLEHVTQVRFAEHHDGRVIRDGSIRSVAQRARSARPARRRMAISDFPLRECGR